MIVKIKNGKLEDGNNKTHNQESETLGLTKKSVDDILDGDIKKILINFIGDNREKLLPKISHGPEIDVKITFYFSEDETKYIIFLPGVNGIISLSNITLPNDGIRGMIFVFYYILKSNKKKLTGSVIPLKKNTPKMARRREILYNLYRSFGIDFLGTQGNSDIDFDKEIKLFFDLENPQKLKFLYTKIQEFLKTGKWIF